MCWAGSRFLPDGSSAFQVQEKVKFSSENEMTVRAVEHGNRCGRSGKPAWGVMEGSVDLTGTQGWDLEVRPQRRNGWGLVNLKLLGQGRGGTNIVEAGSYSDRRGC